jgi:hypothetical protein
MNKPGGEEMARRMKPKLEEGAESMVLYDTLTPDEMDSMMAEDSVPWEKPGGYDIYGDDDGQEGR